jgi:hypothetical protein
MRRVVVAMAHLGKGWVSGYMRSGRYAYQKVLVHTTNPDHLIIEPSCGTFLPSAFRDRATRAAMNASVSGTPQAFS